MSSTRIPRSVSGADAEEITLPGGLPRQSRCGYSTGSVAVGLWLTASCMISHTHKALPTLGMPRSGSRKWATHSNGFGALRKDAYLSNDQLYPKHVGAGVVEEILVGMVANFQGIALSGKPRR